MKASTPSRGPALFGVDEAGQSAAPDTVIREERGPIDEVSPAPGTSVARKSRGRWMTGLFWGAMGLLASLFLVDAIWSLVLDLGIKHPVAGQVGLALVGIIAAVALLWLAREVASLFRLRAITRLREAVRVQRAQPDAAGAIAATRAFLAFYAREPESAQARREVEQSLTEILDPHTRLDLVERQLMAPRDDEARRAVIAAAQRVSLVTALSPRALLDILFVLAQSVMLIRRISAIYGGRASGYGLFRLATQVAGHLAVTGGVAAAEEMLSQLFGAGLAARVSAKLGEGLLNGILTARIGIAAISACRPMDFHTEEPLNILEVVKKLGRQHQVAENPAESKQ